MNFENFLLMRQELVLIGIVLILLIAIFAVGLAPFWLSNMIQDSLTPIVAKLSVIAQ